MADPFRWHREGDGHLDVPLVSPSVVAHEVLYEEDISHIDDAAMAVGDSIPHIRFRVLVAGLLALTGLLLLRAAGIQIGGYDTYAALAERNRLREQVLPARRGLIRDRDGAILAENTPSFDVHVIPSLLPRDQEEREEFFLLLGRQIGMSVADMENIVSQAKDIDDAVLLRRDIPYAEAIAVQILSADRPEIEVVIGHKRKYTYSADIPSISHVLGYIGIISPEELEERQADGYRQVDSLGKTGIEYSYERTLRGEPGYRLFEVDSRHRVTATVEERLPADGKDVVLTLDLDLQTAAERALRAMLEHEGLSKGVVVAMDPRDGAIRALVSIPAYDNNLFSGRVSSTVYARLVEDENRPLLPRAWAGMYPSGSTIKPAVATAALEEGIVTPDTRILSVGGIQIGPWFFPDWKAGGHGPTGVRSAIAWSVNTFFYYVGGGYQDFVGLGVDRLSAWFLRFGFGAQTGIDIPGELAGLVPTREWKLTTKNERWFIGDTYNLSIGQGDLLVTPLQIARMTAVVANGGREVTPHLVETDGAASEGGEDRVASESTIIAVRQGMRDTVVYGSGRSLAGFPVDVSGKTGTAQWRADRDPHAWFTAFAPFNDPEIVVTVLLEEGEEGSRTAIPVARDILYEWLRQESD